MQQSQSQLTGSANEITLQGSVAVVSEFLGLAVNSVLYQRGIYAASTFRPVPKYGLSCLMTTDAALLAYVKGVLQQVAVWLSRGEVQKCVGAVGGRGWRRGVRASKHPPPPPQVCPRHHGRRVSASAGAVGVQRPHRRHRARARRAPPR